MLTMPAHVRCSFVKELCITMCWEIAFSLAKVLFNPKHGKASRLPFYGKILYSETKVVLNSCLDGLCKRSPSNFDMPKLVKEKRTNSFINSPIGSSLPAFFKIARSLGIGGVSPLGLRKHFKPSVLHLISLRWWQSFRPIELWGIEMVHTLVNYTLCPLPERSQQRSLHNNVL